MIYIAFLTRDPLTTFNSIYAYSKTKGFPKKILILYTDEDLLNKLLSPLKFLFEIYGKEVSISTRRIEDDFSDIKEVFESIDEDFIVDITGARKSQIIALMSCLRRGKISYLKLEDMKYSHLPFMMRPMPAQKIMEVNIDEYN